MDWGYRDIISNVPVPSPEALVSEPASLVRDTVIDDLAKREEMCRKEFDATEKRLRRERAEHRKARLVHRYLAAKFPHAMKSRNNAGEGSIATLMDAKEIERIAIQAERWALGRVAVRLCPPIFFLAGCVGSFIVAAGAVSEGIIIGFVLTGLLTFLGTVATVVGSLVPSFEVWRDG